MSTSERLGRYRLLHRVGAGGMGEVHRARAYGAEGVVKELCIKRIRVERLSASGALDAFVREARLSARMAHPNIVPVFDFGRCEDQYYLAMEWIDGVDLSTLLAGGPLADEVVAHLAAEVARALSYAHEAAPDAPIVHRDVKPANVLVSRTGDVRLGDFGVASSVGTPSGVAGTKAYMAPEASRGEACPASDVFSLGTLIARARGPASDDDALGALVRELVAEDPEARPSAASAAARLEAFVAGFVARGAPSPRAALAARVAEIADEPAGSSRERPLPETHSFLHAPEPTATTAAPVREQPTPPRRRSPALLGAALLALATTGGIGWWLGGSSVEAARAPARLATPMPPEAPAAGPEPREEPAPIARATPAPSRVEIAPISAEPVGPAEPGVPVAEARPARAPRHRPAAVPAPVAQAAPGVLSINAIPWARVIIDGTPRGTTPLLGVALSPSVAHRVELVNDVLGTRAERSVRLDAGERDTLIVDLQSP